MKMSRLLRFLMRSLMWLAIVLLWALSSLGQDMPILSPNVSVQYDSRSPRTERQGDDSDTSATRGRSYVAPVFRFMETVNSNPQLGQQQSGTEAGSMVSGDLALHHVWRHADMNLLYQGGASFYSNSSTIQLLVSEPWSSADVYRTAFDVFLWRPL